MSQTNFLETIEMWSVDECLENLPFALPKLICLQEENVIGVSEKETLKIIFGQFISHLSLQESEEKVFNKISGWLKKTFHSNFDLIKNIMMNNLKSLESIKPLLQDLCFVLDCLACYIDKIFNKHKEVQIRHVSSLCTVTLHIVCSCYGHCKESINIYGSILETMNEALNFLFNSTGDLLTKVNLLLHNVSVQTPSDLHFVLSILDGLSKIGEVVFDIDVRMMASVWRLYIKIAMDHESLIKQDLEIGPTLDILIIQLQNKLEKFKQIKVEDEKPFMQLIRMSGFLLKIIVLLCDKYGGHIGSCQIRLMDLILFLYKMSPPALDAISLTPNLNHEINQHLTVGIEPLIENLMRDYSFISAVLEDDKYVSRSESGLDRCILLLSILEKLPKLKKAEFDQWMSQISDNKPSSILSAIFNILPSCHIELALPVYLMETVRGKGSKNISLYEYIYTRLCRFVVILPARHFYYLEKILITNLLTTNFWRRQISMDVWSFLGRYSSPNLCYQHCCVLTNIVNCLQNSKSEVAVHILCLWHRLTHFLSNEHLKQFSTSNPELIVTQMTITERSPANLIYPIKNQYEKSVSTLSVFLKSPSDVSENDLMISLQAAYKIIRANQAYLTSDDISRVASLTRMAASLHRIRPLNSLLRFNSTTLIEQFLLLTGELTHDFCGEEISQVLKSIEIIIKSLSCTARLCVTKCLINLRTLENDPSMPKETLHLISYLFSLLLQDSNWIVLDYSLNAFASFAHETVYTSVIPKTTNNNKELQDQVTNYLNQIPWKNDNKIGAIEFLKNQKLTMLNNNNRNQNNFQETTTTSPTTTTNPPLDEEKIRFILEQIHLNVSDLIKISFSQPLPNWAKEELNQIQSITKSLSN